MNAGQMFMSMIQSVTQPVTADNPLTALQLAGEQKKSGAVFADLLGDIRMQTNAKAVSGTAIDGSAALSDGVELSPVSVSSNSSEVPELPGAESDRNSDISRIQDESANPETSAFDVRSENAFPGGIPINLEMFAAGTQAALAAYAPPGRMPVVNFPSNHEVVNVQDVPRLIEPGPQLFTSEVPVKGRFAEQLEPGEQSFRAATAGSDHLLAQQRAVSASPLTPPAPHITGKATIPVLVQPQTEAAQAAEVFDKPESIPSPANRAQLDAPERNLTAPLQQSGRMPIANSQPSHEVDNVQNVPITPEPGQPFIATEAPVKVLFGEQLRPSPQPSIEQNTNPVTPGHQSGRVGTAPNSTTDKPVSPTAEQSYRFATVEPAQRLPQQPKVSAAATQAISTTAAPEFVSTQTAAASEMEVAAKPEATQQAERTPSVNRTHAEQSYRFATEEPAQKLPQQPKVSTASTQAISTTAAPEFVKTQTAAAPVMEVAAKPEVAQQTERIPSVNHSHLEAPVQNLTVPQQQPSRIPVINSPPSHEVDSTQKAVTTTIAAELPHVVPAAQIEAQPLPEQAVRPVQVNQQSGRVETAPIATTDKPVLQSAEQSYRFATAEPEQQLPQQPKESTAATQAISTTAAPEFVSTQTAAAPVMQVAAKPEEAQQTERIPSVNLAHLEAPVQNLTAPQQQPGRIPVINSPPSPEVDSTQKTVTTTVAAELSHVVPAAQIEAQPLPEQAVRPVQVNQQSGRVETTPIATTDKPVLQSAEQSYRFATEEPAQKLPQQPNVSAAATQAISTTAAPEFVSTQTAAAPVMEVAAKPEVAQQAECIPSVNHSHLEAPVENLTVPQQQPSRIPVVNSPPSHEVDSTQKAVTTTIAVELPHVVPAAQIEAQPLPDQAVRPVQVNQQSGRVETAPIATTDKPVLQSAEQSYRFATAKPEQQLPQQPNVSAAATQAISTTAAPEFVSTQTAAAPVMQVAAKPEVAQQAERIPSVNHSHLEAPVQNLTVPQQQPSRIPVVNSPPSPEVDSTQKTVTTTVAAELPHVVPAAQIETQPPFEQAVSQQSGRVERAPVPKTDKPVLQTADHTEPVSAVSPEPLLSGTPAPASSESEAEIVFSMPRPIVVSKTRSTESSRMLQTAAIMRPQIISLDIDQPQNNTAEFGTVNAVTPETSSPATVQRHENGRMPETTFPPNPEIGLTQKARFEVATTNTSTTVQPSEEANQIKDFNSVPMQQAIRRVTVQVSPNANSEIAKPNSNQAVTKENTVFQQNAVPADEAPLTSNDSMGNNGDQAWSGQRSDNQMVTGQIHAQSKTEPQTVGTVPNVRNNAEQVRQDLPEQIAHQVRERLTQHEVKPGNQQISLTLSPENMGELKMNLNLQGQRLSVEIVTESRTVRDAIMQHSDSLKESLARQNITVESFDVTSNGRGSGNPGHNNQDAWKELARQKQQQLWTTSGGYRLPQMDAAPNTLAYQAKNEHGMLDIHY